MVKRLTARNTAWLAVVFAAIAAVTMTSMTSAQNPASNKAFFAKSLDQVTLGAISGTGSALS